MHIHRAQLGHHLEQPARLGGLASAAQPARRGGDRVVRVTHGTLDAVQCDLVGGNPVNDAVEVAERGVLKNIRAGAVGARRDEAAEPLRQGGVHLGHHGRQDVVPAEQQQQ